MDNGSPANSGGRLASEFNIKADLGGEAFLERTLSKRDDLRVAAMENYASQKAKDSGDGSPLIGARRPSQQHSPNKTTSTMASDTILGAADGALQRQGSATFSTGAVPRSSRSRSPTKRPAAAVMEAYEELFRGQDGSDMGSQGSQGPCGLDFLLQACDILEPEGSQLAKTKARRTVVRPTLPSAPPPERDQPVRARRARRYSDEEQYTQMESSDEDEYRPAGRGRSTRRPSQRAVAAAAAAAASDGDGSVGAAPTVRWERGMVTGPCTNPDCEHPYDSPQWRKGPAQCPILCNACGTRWLRNGTLKPLVPRRGIRYNKPRPRPGKPSARTSLQPALDHAMPGYASEQMVEPVYAPEEPVTQQPMAEPRPLPAPGAPHELLAAAMAGVHGMGMPMFAPTNVSFDAMALQQHLAAMTAAAQAAQQAYAAVAAAGMAEPPTLKPAPVPGDKGRPVFHIQAVAGPAVPAPRFVMPTDTGCDTHMADAS